MTSEKLPIDTSCEAEYEDGFILSETEQDDLSLYTPVVTVEMNGEQVATGKNTFDDIYHKRPEPEHGKMVRFSVFYHNARYDIDWTTLPEGARPIRLRDGTNSRLPDGTEVFDGFNACRMGYQLTDSNGRNQQFIDELA